MARQINVSVTDQTVVVDGVALSVKMNDLDLKDEHGRFASLHYGEEGAMITYARPRNRTLDNMPPVMEVLLDRYEEAKVLKAAAEAEGKDAALKAAADDQAAAEAVRAASRKLAMMGTLVKANAKPGG